MNKQSRLTEQDIAFELGNHWVLALSNGTYEVYKNSTTHSVRVAQIGYKDAIGLSKAIEEATRRESKDTVAKQN